MSSSELKRIQDACRDNEVTPPDIQADDRWLSMTFARQDSTVSAGSVCRGMRGGQKGGSMGTAIALTARQREILLIIEKNNKVRYRSIAQRLEINNSAVKKHLNALKEKGVLKRTGGTRGHWEILIHEGPA